jgi:hypothetical protein
MNRESVISGTGESTESPIFDAPFWSENGVSCPQCGHERNKIGDSVLWTGRTNGLVVTFCKRPLDGLWLSMGAEIAQSPFPKITQILQPIIQIHHTTSLQHATKTPENVRQPGFRTKLHPFFKMTLFLAHLAKCRRLN